jgi:hypothetical protein
VLRLELINTKLYLAEVEVLVVPFFSDRIPLKGAVGWVDWLLCGHLSQALKRGGLTGAKREKAVLMGYGKFRAGRIMAYGLGEAEGALPLIFEGMFADLVGVVQDMGLRSFAAPTMRTEFYGWDYGDLVRSLVRGVYQGVSLAGPLSDGGFGVGIIEESSELMRSLEDAAREIRAEYSDKLDSEIVVSETV